MNCAMQNQACERRTKNIDLLNEVMSWGPKPTFAFNILGFMDTTAKLSLFDVARFGLEINLSL